MLSITSRRSFLFSSLCSPLLLRAAAEASVRFANLPDGGLQPQAAVDNKGVLHLVYLLGDPAKSDVFYVRKNPDANKFSAPMRVNSIPGSAIALGTVRGAHIAIGASGLVHVAWNGSSAAELHRPANSAPMLYARMNKERTGFEPERNLMTTSSGLDGGGTVAADSRGNVYVVWHAQGIRNGAPVTGEAYRRVWLSHSADSGQTFDKPRTVSPENAGACGCCGLGASTDAEGNLYVLYRSAKNVVNRDMYLLRSKDRGKTFSALDIHPWQIGACPMSTVSLTPAGGRVLLSWETARQVYFAPVDVRTGKVGKPISPPGEGNNRKHPTIAGSRNGEILLAWTEGTGWKKGGTLGWAVFDAAGKTVATNQTLPSVPAWDFAAAVPENNGFVLIS